MGGQGSIRSEEQLEGYAESIPPRRRSWPLPIVHLVVYLLLCALPFAPVGAAGTQTTVALLDVADGELTAEQQKSWQNWRDLLQVQLCQDRSWAVVERSRLNKILQELELRFYGRGAEDRAILQGGMLGAELLIQPITKQKGETPEITLAVISTRLAERVGEAALKWPLPPVEALWRESLSKELQSARDVLDKTRNQPTVAVLFFENETKEGRFQYLGEKLEKSLADALVKTGKFHVLRRQEVVTARPETVLVATGWTQPSALWQAQHADVLVYGTYTTKPDPRVPVDEQPFQVEYTVVSRSHITVTTRQHPFKLVAWNASSNDVSEQIWQVVQQTLGRPAVSVPPRKEAEKLFERGLRICVVKNNAGYSQPEITREFLSDADAKALHGFLLASFLAPDWEVPWRYFIAMYVKTTRDWGDNDNTLAFAAEYFSRFGGMETENGRNMCCIVYLRAALKLAYAARDLKPGKDLDGFHSRNRLAFEIAEGGFLAAVRGPIVPSERPAKLEYDPVMADRTPTNMAINFPSTMNTLGAIPDKTWVFDLFEKTKPRWLQHPERYSCLCMYARASRTPRQKQAVREELFRWSEENRRAGKTWSAHELVLIRHLLWLTSAGRGSECGDGVLSAVPLDEVDEKIMAKVSKGEPVDRSTEKGEAANGGLPRNETGQPQRIQQQPNWELLQRTREQLGKPRWRDVRRLGNTNYFFFPTLPLTMPQIKVAATPVVFWEPFFREVKSDERPSVSKIHVLNGNDENVCIGLDYCARYRESRWMETGALLFTYHESTGNWCKVTTLDTGREASIRSVATSGDRTFIGTQMDGLWIIGPKPQDRRRLSLEDGLPTQRISTVIALNDQIWVLGGEDKLAVARVDPISLKVFVPPISGVVSSMVVPGAGWNHHIWLIAGRQCLDLDPSSLAARIHDERSHFIPAMATTENHLVLCSTHRHDGVSGGSLGEGLLTVDRSLKSIDHGIPLYDAYEESLKGSACLATVSDAELGWVGETCYRASFGFAASRVEGVRVSTAEVEYLKSGKVGLMWNKDVWVRDRKSKLLPRTRIPVASCLAGDGKWLWIVSGRRLFLYRPDSQTWHGMIILPYNSWSIAVTRQSIWLGTEGLHKGAGLLRIDKEAALKGALEDGLPNAVTTEEVEEAIRRLPMGDQGVFYFGLGRFTEAAKCLDRAVEIDITEPQYFLVLFMIHSPWGLNQAEKFHRYGDRLMELYPNTTWSGTVEDWWKYVKTNPPKKESAK